MIELYTYCVRNMNMYGILSSVNKSWLFKVHKGTLYVSKLVELKDLLQQVYNMMKLAYEDPDPDTQIPPIPSAIVPLNPIQNRQQSQQTSSSNRDRGKRKASEQNGPDENSTVNWRKSHLYRLSEV